MIIREVLKIADWAIFGYFVALNSGYHLAFLVGAAFLVAAGTVGAALLRVEAPQVHGSEEAIAEAA